jgi:hypothetical protein
VMCRFYGGIGLCCVVLLIVILLYLGLCVGACTKAPEEEMGSCHRGIGANLLVALVPDYKFLLFDMSGM